MLSETMVLILGYVFGFYMSWNIGANDVANSMASAVGAKAITIRQAVLIAGILNCLGAIVIGSLVTAFIDNVESNEQVPAGYTTTEWLWELTFAGARRRYGGTIPSDVRSQLQKELSLIDELEYGGIVERLARIDERFEVR